MGIECTDVSESSLLLTSSSSTVGLSFFSESCSELLSQEEIPKMEKEIRFNV